MLIYNVLANVHFTHDQVCVCTRMHACACERKEKGWGCNVY